VTDGMGGIGGAGGAGCVDGIGRGSARAFAPASIGNLGPGLDILGLAVAGIGDEVCARLVERGRGPGVWMADPGHAELSRDAGRHAAGIAAREVLRRGGVGTAGVELTVRKGIPLSGGLGGSAASAVAGAVAVNAMLATPLERRELLAACLAAESAVAGRHLDNVAASLAGGCVIVRSVEECDVHRIPTPPGLCVVLVHPHQRVRTMDSRSVLPASVERDVLVTQGANLAALVAALMSSDHELMRRSMEDIVAEPVRAPLLKGFREAKEAACAAGALGCSISGSGPAAFALARGEEEGERIARAMRDAYGECGLESDVYVTTVDEQGARVVE